MKKTSIEITVGIFLLIGILCVGYLTIKLGKMEIFGENYYLLKAQFDSVSGLKSGGMIEMAGVKVGQIDSIILDRETQTAIVELKIYESVKLSDDVIASVKTDGLIGDKYIKLYPGGSDDILESGDIIFETESALDMEEMVSKYIFGDV